MCDKKELSDILGQNLTLNKWHRNFLGSILIGLLTARTVNLSLIALMIGETTLRESCYRRLQRFFAKAQLCMDEVAMLVVSVVWLPKEPLKLAIDRTNWKYGSTSINLLVLAAVHRGVAIPIMWKQLAKQGNSNTQERIALLDRFCSLFGKDRIGVVLGDREFIGEVWFKYLQNEDIPYLMRIKESSQITNSRGLYSPAKNIFRNLKVSETRHISSRILWGQQVNISGLRLESGELLLLASSRSFEDPLGEYGRRWEIESLFQGLKGRGFDLEATRLLKTERIEKMIGVLAIACCWCISTGVWATHKIKPLRIKKHQRLEKSLFRYGLDVLTQRLTGARFSNLDTQILGLLRAPYTKPPVFI